MATDQRLSSTVIKAFSVLNLLASKRGTGATLQEVTTELDASKSTAHRYLVTLEHLGVVERDESDEFFLGPVIAKLGGAYLRDHSLRRVAQPFLDRLARSTQETIHLAVPSGDEAVYIAKIDSVHSVQMASAVGSRAALHCTSLGKAILAYLPDTLEQIIQNGIESKTPHTIVAPKALRAELEQVRKKGYAIDNQENELGVRCVGAPVFDHMERVIGAISISGPSNRITKAKAVQWGALVREASMAVSERIGHVGHP